MAERVEDLNLPNSVVTRIIKDCVPKGVNVSKEARTAIARAASVFVLYLTSSSNNVSMQANRKTISANDVFKALVDTDFEMFVDPLKESLEGFKKFQQDKKQRQLNKKAEEGSADTSKTGESENQNEIMEVVDEEAEDANAEEEDDDQSEEEETTENADEPES